MAPSKINVKDRLSEDGEIDLSMSEIQDVPVKEIIAFKKAYSLDLSNNNISKLPKAFPTLTHITKLDLSKNLLKELPENFGDLIRLKHLDLYQNQLEHLPLSFSKLKALKWLDLKDNPLVPAVAKVAGLCVDSKQCQICAKNVVSFFTNLQNKVDTEKEMREKHRKKQLEVNQQKVREEKKSKKKEKVKAHIENGVNKEVGTKNVEASKSIKQKKNEEKPVEVVRRSRLLNILFYVAFFSSMLFILTSVKSKRYAKIEFQVVNVYSKILEALPQNLRSYGVQGGEVFKNFHEKTGQGILHVYDYLNNDPQIKYIHSWIVDTCKVLLLKIETFYKNTFK